MERQRPSQEPKPKVDLQAKLDNQRAFVDAVVEDGAHLRIPQEVSEAKWQRQKEIVAKIIGMDFTGGDLGEMFGIERKRVRQIFNDGVKNLWNNSSPKTQERFPLESILGIRKPMTLKLAEKQSAARGGNLAQIRELAEAGVRSPGKIAEILRIPKEAVRNSAEKLSKRGIVFARENSSLKDIEASILATDDNGELREILDGISDNTIRSMRQRKSKSIVPLAKMVRELGLYPAKRDLYFLCAVLEDNNIPVREMLVGFLHSRNGKKYRKGIMVVLEKHKQKISQALNSDPDLQRFKRNPVTLICGPWKGELPTSTISNKVDEYSVLSKLMHTLTGPRLNNFRKRYAEVLKDCPVPIFKVGKSYYYSIDRKNELKEFLEEKLQNAFQNNGAKK